MKNINFTQNLKGICTGILLSGVFLYAGCSKEETLNSESAQLSNKQSATSSSTPSDLPAPCITRCLVAGQHTYVGSVDVALNNAGDILVTYSITKPGIYLLETHADIFNTVEQFKKDKKVSGGGAVPGKFAFKQAWSASQKFTKYTVTIPKSYVDKYTSTSKCINIATHAALSNGETAWGGLCTDAPKGVSLDSSKQFPGNNWSTYFEFCLDECKGTIDFTYAWEDMQNQGNDADYNDLVIQADLNRSGQELKLTFLATARGAYYDHMFKVRIPKKGITGVFNEDGSVPTVQSDGSDYIITVFESTKTVLKANNGWNYANTWEKEACTPFAYKEIVLTTNNEFTYDPAKPYLPFLSVYPSGTVGTGRTYDLSIYELTGRDTWKTPDGKTYPNGILIPRDWRWPFERQNIIEPYPNFFSAGWADNLAKPELTFDKNRCN